MFERIDEQRRIDVVQDLDRASAINGDYLLLVFLSCVIATFGLVLNSAAIIIGAMLIAPLMSPILGFALAVIMSDARRAAHSLLTLAVGVLIAITLSDALGQLVSSGQYNFLVELPSEILSRTHPTLFDLFVALAGGAAASYALAQPHLSATLPGVAIATALMPPVCVIGIGLAQGHTDIVGGALLLFLANFVAIVFAGSVVFTIVGFVPPGLIKRSRRAPTSLLLPSLLLALVVGPLGAFGVQIARDARENAIIRTTIADQLAHLQDGSLDSFVKSAGQSSGLRIVATIRAPRSLTYTEARQIQQDVAVQLQEPVALTFLVIPVTKLDTVVPPTPIPTVASGVVPTVTSIPIPTETSTPAPTSLPTATPRPTSTPEPSPTASPGPTVMPVTYAIIGATDNQGANLRRGPSLSDAVIGGLPDGVIVEVMGPQQSTDGLTWAEVIDPEGRVGWVASPYLIPYRAYVPPT